MRSASFSASVKSDLRKEFGLDALDMTGIVLVLEPIFRMKIPQWALTELFVTPMDIVEFICDKKGVVCNYHCRRLPDTVNKNLPLQ